MITISNKQQCCGCGACSQKCPKHCIELREDNEGFLYPDVDMRLCVDCGLCEKVCPMRNLGDPKRTLSVFAAQNINELQCQESSSGGIFILLAEQVIRNGGVVFGARFDNNWEVKHCYAETMEELAPLMRSKYVQSRIGNTYIEAEQFLKQDRQVLFVGTSCQIAGLRNFLRREYDNLLAVDFICHGVPSPGVWRKVIHEVNAPITSINFRAKQSDGFNWSKYGFVIKGISDKKDDTSIIVSKSAVEFPYFLGFLSNLYLRPTCHSCLHKGINSISDITIADYWHYVPRKESFFKDKGISMVILRTEPAMNFWNKISLSVISEPSNIELAMSLNHGFMLSKEKHPKREHFFQLYHQTDKISSLIEKELHRNIFVKIKDKIKVILKGNNIK